MAVRSNRLVGPVAHTGTSAVFTCPAGRTAIIKSLSMVNVGGGGVTVSLYINGTGSGDLVHRQAVGAAATVQLPELWLVLEPGDVLHLGTTGTTSITVHGALLLGAPA